MSSLFYFLWTISIHFTLKSNGQSYVNVDCITVNSGPWVFGATQTVSCSDAGAQYANYVMTGCGWQSSWYQCQGSSINENGECEAIPTSSSGRVRAVAQCCDIGAFVSCATVSNSINSAAGSLTTATCQNAHVVGCVSQGESCADATNCDTAIANGDGAITNEICTGYKQSNTGSTLSVQSVCCSTDNEEIECQQIIGDVSDNGDDDLSIISCADTLGSEWFLTSCNEYTTLSNPKLDGHYTVNGDECRAQNSYRNDAGVRAVAQCCRIATSEPTVSPTDAPSKLPTMDGCDFDLDTYLDQCYGIQPGFNLGSAHSNGGYESSLDKYEFDDLKDKINELLGKYDENYNYNNNIMLLFIFTNCLVLFSVVMMCLCSNGRSVGFRNKHRYRKVDVISASDDEPQQLQ